VTIPVYFTGAAGAGRPDDGAGVRWNNRVFSIDLGGAGNIALAARAGGCPPLVRIDGPLGGRLTPGVAGPPGRDRGKILKGVCS